MYQTTKTDLSFSTYSGAHSNTQGPRAYTQPDFLLEPTDCACLGFGNKEIELGRRHPTPMGKWTVVVAVVP